MHQMILRLGFWLMAYDLYGTFISKSIMHHRKHISISSGKKGNWGYRTLIYCERSRNVSQRPPQRRHHPYSIMVTLLWAKVRCRRVARLLVVIPTGPCLQDTHFRRCLQTKRSINYRRFLSQFHLDKSLSRKLSLSLTAKSDHGVPCSPKSASMP